MLHRNAIPPCWGVRPQHHLFFTLLLRPLPFCFLFRPFDRNGIPPPPRLTPGDVLGLGLVLFYGASNLDVGRFTIFETPTEARVALGLLLEDFLPRIFFLAEGSPSLPLIPSFSLHRCGLRRHPSYF